MVVLILRILVWFSFFSYDFWTIWASRMPSFNSAWRAHFFLFYKRWFVCIFIAFFRAFCRKVTFLATGKASNWFFIIIIAIVKTDCLSPAIFIWAIWSEMSFLSTYKTTELTWLIVLIIWTNIFWFVFGWTLRSKMAWFFTKVAYDSVKSLLSLVLRIWFSFISFFYGWFWFSFIGAVSR